MNKHRYVYETARTSSDKTIPWPYALAALLVLVAAVGWFAEAGLPRHGHAAPDHSTAAVAVSHAPAHAAKNATKADHRRLMS
jgi:hypothetical protein